MAEKSNITTEVFAGGLHTDFNPANQPEYTYRFALNAINESREGHKNLLSNEEGNVVFIPEIGDDGDKWIILGGIYIDDNEHIIFLVNEDESKSILAKLTSNKILEHLITDHDNDCLNFKVTNQILGTYRLRNGCEKTVYWVDGLNNVRSFSPSRLDRYIDEFGNIIDCKRFDLVKYTEEIPTFDDAEVVQGGNLLSGTYNFAIQYIDNSGNTTVWLTTSMTIPIYKSSLFGDYDNIMGSSNKIEGENVPIEGRMFGSPPTNKAIKLTIGHLDTDYAYYRIACIEATSGTGLPNRVLLSTNIPTTEHTFIHDGNLSKFTEGTIEEILLNVADIGMAKYLTQVENRLLIANVKTKGRDYCNYQKFASRIRTKYVVDRLPLYDYEVVGDSKNPSSYFEKISYMGGEVYAFGIVYIFENGVESPAYHIPGRPPTSDDMQPLDYNEMGIV